MNANRARIVVLLTLVAVLCGMVYAQVREVYTYPQSNAQYRVYEHEFDDDDFDFSATNVILIPAKDPNKVPFYDPNGNPTTDPNFYYDDPNNTLVVPIIDVNSFDANSVDANSITAVVDVNSPIYYLGDSATYITTDGSDLTLTDAVYGTKTLSQLGSPTYLYIKATTQSEGNLHLSDATNWGYSKVFITQIRVVTSSTDWDLYILQNDNGYAADDATIGKFLRVTEISGDATLLMNLPYEDEDASSEVHLYYNDDSGANTADIYIIGYGLI